MFAMKRVILAAAFIVAISGFAAAQSTSAKPASSQQKAIVKKGPAVKNTTKSTVLKQETSANAKVDAVKLVLPAPPAIADSTAMPAVTNKE
jgi:hypothetical protein